MAKRPGGNRPLYAVVRFVLIPVYRIFYRLTVRGAENLPKDGPVLLCSNHMAMKDPLMLAAALKRQISYMAKEELFHNPILGWLLRHVKAFPVNRGSGGADALDEAYHVLDDNGVVGIFIEGTRSKTGELLRPKTGAALLAYRSKAPVVPVCITCEDGKPSTKFKRTLIEFGKPISAEQLAIPDESSMQLRKASRTIMSEITAMREKAAKEFGFPMPEPAAKRREKTENAERNAEDESNGS